MWHHSPYSFNPFPHTAILQQTSLKTSRQNTHKNPINKVLIIVMYWKHCGKRRNCLFWAIYTFVRMIFKSCLLQMHHNTSTSGKGLTLSLQPSHIHKICNRWLSKNIGKNMENASLSVNESLIIEWAISPFFLQQRFCVNSQIGIYLLMFSNLSQKYSFTCTYF